jgi:hypothetical protein
MNTRHITVAAILVLASSTQILADQRAVDAINAVVRARTEVAEDRRARIETIVQNVFLPAPSLSESDTQGLVTDFRAYADDRLWRNAELSTDEFELAIDTFEWAAENAVHMPIPAAIDESIADKAIASLEEAIRNVVDELYNDVPKSAREKIAQDATLKIRLQRGAIVSRFYPDMLKPAAEQFERKATVDSLLNQARLQGAKERWGSVAEIQANNTLPESSRQIHVDFFVERESLAVSNAAMDLLRTWFIMPETASDMYKNMPDDLLARYGDHRTKFEENLRKQREEEARRAERRGGRQILKDAGATTPGGRPVPPRSTPK